MNSDIQKLQEDIVKKDINDQEKMFKSMELNNSLVYHLDRMTKDELVKVAQRYSVRGLTALKKAEVVERVSVSIIEKIDNSIDIFNEDLLSLILEITKNNGILKYDCSKLIQANFLRNRGLLFAGSVDEDLNLIMPEEVLEVLKSKINEDAKERIHTNTEIIKLVAGLVYYYGVLSLDEVTELLGKYLEIDSELFNIEKLIAIGEELGLDYKLDNKIIYHIDVEDEEKILKMKTECSNDYYKFDKKSLIKASKMDYMDENKQASKLEKALNELFVVDKKILKEEIESFSIMIKNEESIEEAIDIFLEAYEIENDEEREILKYELIKLAKSIRRWSFKGYTEAELENKEKTIVVEEKIGRNDPCPCGSKKKYKKCCGK